MNIDGIAQGRTRVQSNTQSNSFISGKTFGICIGVIALIIALVTAFELSYDTLLYAGILLACPLMHIWMMRSGKHSH